MQNSNGIISRCRTHRSLIMHINNNSQRQLMALRKASMSSTVTVNCSYSSSGEYQLCSFLRIVSAAYAQTELPSVIRTALLHCEEPSRLLWI